jgi:hypothetical protein
MADTAGSCELVPGGGEQHRRSAASLNLDHAMRLVSLFTLSICAVAVACERSDPPAPAACTAPPVSIDSTTRTGLVQARDAVWRAFYAGDSARLTELLPEPMVGMPGSRADIIADAKQSASSGRRLVELEFTCDEFYLNGDVAVVFSHFRTTIDEKGKGTVNSGRAIELFERRDGKWVNPSWHLDDDQ